LSLYTKWLPILKVWEQHPNKDRYQREVFENFFKGAIESKGAFKIVEKSMEIF
jgi:hypothetical protein